MLYIIKTKNYLYVKSEWLCFLLNRCKRIIPLFLAVLIWLPGCTGTGTAPEAAPVKKPAPPEKVRIAIVGDFLMHMPVVNSARTPGTGWYDFKKIFREVGPDLSEPDFTTANLETRLAGPKSGYSGYPRFNTPADLAGDMKDLGIDLVTTANNHSMDRGRQGVLNTLDNLDKAGLNHIGTYRSPEERDSPVYFDINGIRVGFINYTQDTNGLPVPTKAGYMVNIIKRDAMLSEIDRLKKRGCQFIIAVIHSGTEYQRHPNEFQKTVARELFDAGVDVVAGSHPHVIEPLEWQTRNIGGVERKVLAAYSLGNFISNQRWRYSDCGIILNLNIVKQEDGSPVLEGADYIPVWVDTFEESGLTRYRVLPVSQAIKNYEAGADPLLTERDYYALQQVWRDTTMLLGPEFTPGS